MTRSEELFFDIRTINNIRKDMACNLLAGTSDVQDMCRKCTMHYTLNDNWVQCESCHWWQHFQCTTIQKTFNEVNQEDYRFICDICSFK